MVEFDLDQDLLPQGLDYHCQRRWLDVVRMLDLVARRAHNHGNAIKGGRAMPAYDPDNIFAKLLRGEIPSTRVYEDAETLAFMDIMPRADGHLLVVPKTPCRNLLDASPKQLAAVMATVQKLSHAVMRAFGAEGVTVQQFNEDAGGQEVYHLHFHVLPRHAGESLRPPGQMGDQEQIREQAEKIRAVLAQS